MKAFHPRFVPPVLPTGAQIAHQIPVSNPPRNQNCPALPSAECSSAANHFSPQHDVEDQGWRSYFPTYDKMPSGLDLEEVPQTDFPDEGLLCSQGHRFTQLNSNFFPVREQGASMHTYTFFPQVQLW